MRSAALLFALALAAAPAAPQTAKPAAKTAADGQLQVSAYVCIMTGDEDVIEDHPGKCPKCGMDLHPVVSVWTCPVHAAIHETKPGKCPIDKRDLIPVTMLLTWTCPGTTTEASRPGKCADGTPMQQKLSPRAHGNHNPQHGGSFFMAPDSWHHLEGALPGDGVFRVYLYDDFTKPLKPALFRAVKGRIVTEQTFDNATKKTNEIKAFPLVPAAGGKYLEAKIGKTALPASMTARVKFTADGPEYPFDFTFAAYTKEPVGTATPTATTTSAAPAVVPSAVPSAVPSPAAPVPAAAVGSAPLSVDPSSGVDPALIPLPIPDSVPDILAQLRTRTDQIRALIDRGNFGSIYVPAFQAKDLALALDDHKKELTDERRRVEEPAVAKLVRSAYLLDAFGDIGNKQQIAEAYTMFVEAANDIQSVFPK
jgi:hypothetical protein